MKFNDLIFRKYDIRGIVGNELDKDFAVLLGKAFGTIVREKNQSAKWVSIGQDVRISSKELAEGLIEGILFTGLNVYDIGICPTPLQYFSIFNLNLDGGIMVTGSHNPPEYNGFKISIGKTTIHSEGIQELKEIILNKKWISSKSLGKVETYNILKEYQEYMIKEFAYLNEESKYRKVKIVVDAGNGTAGVVAPQILKNIGCEVIELYCEPDGTFPNHHPDPTVIEYIQDLIKKVREVNADIGVGYDGDADRIGIINKNGDIVWGDYIMIILSRAILMNNPQAKIIGDVKCSQTMFDDIENHGGIPIMWKTGHSLIRDKMWKENAILAGEFSGHIFISDRYFGYDDAIYITLRLVEIMKKTGKEIQELLLDIPKMCCTPEIKIECPDEIKNIIIKKILNNLKLYLTHKGDIQIKKIDETDGARVVFDKGWGLLRTSNTQPVIVMRVEAEDEKSLKKYKDFLELQLKAVKG